ncbi:hypothetical protein BGX21_005351, partial [Mortierella sp. AD011]
TMPSQSNTSFLYAGFEFGYPDNQKLVSPEGKFEAGYQHSDGNFCVYEKSTGRCTWHTDTSNKDAMRLIMQTDGNLVMYDKKGKAIWASDTANSQKHETSRLAMQDDGNLVIYTDHGPVWDILSKRQCH